MTKVYFTNVSPLLNDGVFNAALKRVSLKRQEKVNRFKKMEDKILSLASGLIADYAVKSFIGADAVYDIAYQTNGKPCILPHKNIHISISHSGSMALCAVSDFPVGADVQILTEPKYEVCRKYFGKNESEYVLNCENSLKKRNRFFRLWSLKEAYVKMTGDGIWAFGDFEIYTDKEITAVNKCGKIPVRFFEWNVAGYSLAICSDIADGIPEFKNINISDLVIN